MAEQPTIEEAFKQADGDELVRILTTARPEDESGLWAALGNGCYKRMRNARTAIEASNCGRSWGGYQHYGNPYAKLFTADRKPGGS